MTADSGFIEDGPANAAILFILAHGAGQPMDSPFLNGIAGALAVHGFRIVRFEFPYMARRRETGRNSPPDRMQVLCDRWREVYEYHRLRHADTPVIVGGKSLGGRVASLVADEIGADGLVCLGYPFHPPGRPDRLRTAHLEALPTPTLICQGTRDPFGLREEVSGYRLSSAIEVCWIEDGDHSLKPRKKSGRTEAQNLEATVAAMAGFAHRLPASARA